MFGVVELVVAFGREVLETHGWGTGGLGLNSVESLQTDTERGVDAYKQEEGPATVHVEDGFGGNVGCHPSLTPALGYELEEGVCGREPLHMARMYLGEGQSSWLVFRAGVPI
jgi:hypothetical protein